jgi:hypothetical protein
MLPLLLKLCATFRLSNSVLVQRLEESLECEDDYESIQPGAPAQVQLHHRPVILLS